MSDLISRRKAFEYFVTLWECIGTIMDRDEWEDVCMTTANEIPSAEPETSSSGSISCMKSENTHVKTTDGLISRQAAIDAVSGGMCSGWDCDVIDKLKAVSSTESESETGTWIWKHCVWWCSECGKNPTKGTGYAQGTEELFDYCPHCGKKMEGVQM